MLNLRCSITPFPSPFHKKNFYTNWENNEIQHLYYIRKKVQHFDKFEILEIYYFAMMKLPRSRITIGSANGA